ncbi:MAG: hypothetical protein RL266_754 [Bacteroidota bacterium]
MKTSHLNRLILSFLLLPVSLLSQTPDWNTSGNSISSGYFLGTTNTMDLEFWTDNVEKMRLDASGNLGIGTSTPGELLELGTGDLNLEDGIIRIGDNNMVWRDANGNVAFGVQNDLNALTGGAEDNILIGFNAGLSLTGGDRNTLIGSEAGDALTDSDNCTFIGYRAGTAVTTGNNNAFVGSSSGLASTTGSCNTFFGALSGQSATTASQNTLIGFRTGESLTTGADNVVVGCDAARVLTGGSNTAVGMKAAELTTTGVRNTFVGREAGDANTTGNDNTYLGALADGSATITNASAIGSHAYVTASNSLVLGSIASTNGAGAGEDTNVGIGTTSPTERFHVVNNAEEITGLFECENDDFTRVVSATYSGSSSESIIIGVAAEIENTASGTRTNYAVAANAESDIQDHKNVGVYGNADGDAKSCVGVYGRAINAGSASWQGDTKGVEGIGVDAETDNYGGYFVAESPNNTNTANSYGVWATATGATNNYAAYFSGNGVYTGTWTQSSDQKLKKNVERLSGLNIVMQLAPKSYEYQVDKYAFLNLDRGLHYGLIAQEVENVLPQLVDDIVHPARYNQEGELLNEQFEYKGINYMELIPFTISAIQEQQVIVEEKEVRIKTLEEEVARLSAIEKEIETIKLKLGALSATPATEPVMDVQVGVVGELENGRTELHQNQPNPFRQVTTFTYTLGTSGQVELNIYNMEGVFIDNVVRQQQRKGEYKVEWDSKDIPNGMYFYILTVDGVEWVKKAIRLQ